MPKSGATSARPIINEEAGHEIRFRQSPRAGPGVRSAPAPRTHTVHVYGGGCRSSIELARLIADRGIGSVLVVTDAVLLKLEVVTPVLRALEEVGLRVHVFSDVEPDPTMDVVMAGVARLRESGADAVLAIGGGSPIDAAKAMIGCHANGCRPDALDGYFKVRGAVAPFFAIPTTAGTGSEVTVAAVVSDPAAKRKLAVSTQSPEYAELSIFEDMQSSGICGVVNVRSRIERQFGSNRSAYLEATQRGDQLIRGFEPSTLKRGWYNSAHRFKLLRWIGSQIGFSRLDVGVAEPERNLADIPGGLQYHHRRRVSQYMGRDSFFL